MHFEDQLLSWPFFNRNRQVPMNCVRWGFYPDYKSDCGDFNQFLNLNPTETISIQARTLLRGYLRLLNAA
ncbi:hypothetical protein N7523_001033 [Penicillium sp. IBT 18751x]|nr:hypothetical protein N7523_001033 [Penicillium sp. IBT 18751x]